MFWRGASGCCAKGELWGKNGLGKATAVIKEREDGGSRGAEAVQVERQIDSRGT